MSDFILDRIVDVLIFVAVWSVRLTVIIIILKFVTSLMGIADFFYIAITGLKLLFIGE